MHTLDEILAASQLIAIDGEISKRWATADGPSTWKAFTGERYVTLAISSADSPIEAVRIWYETFNLWSAHQTRLARLFWRARPHLDKNDEGRYLVRARLLITDLPDDPVTVEEIKNCTPISRAQWCPLPPATPQPASPSVFRRVQAQDRRGELMADDALKAQIKRVAETSDLLDDAEKALEEARIVWERASNIHHLAKRELESLIRARISAQRVHQDTVGATGEGAPLPNGTM